MDSITLLVTAAAATTIGTGIGLYLGCLFANRKIQRAGHDAWLAAERFYKRAYTLTPKS